VTENVKRWALISLVDVEREVDEIYERRVSSADVLRIGSEQFADHDALACGSLPAMEAALRLLGGET
jgi:hypothetical protein